MSQEMLSQLTGLIEAIDAEAKLPMPSHKNLARLCAEAFRAILKESLTSRNEN